MILQTPRMRLGSCLVLISGWFRKDERRLQPQCDANVPHSFSEDGRCLIGAWGRYHVLCKHVHGALPKPRPPEQHTVIHTQWPPTPLSRKPQWGTVYSPSVNVSLSQDQLGLIRSDCFMECMTMRGFQHIHSDMWQTSVQIRLWEPRPSVCVSVWEPDDARYAERLKGGLFLVHVSHTLLLRLTC